MYLDGFFFNCLVKEIRAQLQGSRVEDVYDSEGENLLVQFRAPGQTLRLEISVQSPPFGFFLAKHSQRRKNTGVFAQTLKKYLAGLFCVSVANPPFERRVALAFASAPDSCPDTFLHIEIMGRENDIFLCQEETIVASTRRPGRGPRLLQPGDRFVPVPAPGKLSPTEAVVSRLQPIFHNLGPLRLDKALVQTIFGISPLLARELCHRAKLIPSSLVRELKLQELETLSQEVCALAEASRQGRGQGVVYDQAGPYWTELQHLTAESRKFSSLSAALEYWLFQSGHGSRYAALDARLRSAIAAAIEKTQRTLAKQELELEKARGCQLYREIGDTLLAAIPTPRGAASLVLNNVHTGQPLKIPLDPEKSGSSNAARYYKKYRKYKNAENKVKGQIDSNRRQLEYLRSLEYALDSAATLPELREIKLEMEEVGLIQARSKERPPLPHREDYLAYRSPGGDLVLVGKNNRQNEALTLRKADKTHYWLHTRHFPGSHVILCNSAPDEADLEFAASLAAWHSKARSETKVEVVWTQVKNVKKIPGAKPGLVQYSQYRSAFFPPRPAPGECREIQGGVQQ